MQAGRDEICLLWNQSSPVGSHNHGYRVVTRAWSWSVQGCVDGQCRIWFARELLEPLASLTAEFSSMPSSCTQVGLRVLRTRGPPVSLEDNHQGAGFQALLSQDHYKPSERCVSMSLVP